MLILSAMCHVVKITLCSTVASFPGPAQLSVAYSTVSWAGPGNKVSSTEHVFGYSDKMKTATAKVGGITQNIERKRARFQEKYSKGGITRAAVNENVCEDSHTVHV